MDCIGPVSVFSRTVPKKGTEMVVTVMLRGGNGKFRSPDLVVEIFGKPP